jgi:hypothetical protein
MEASQIENAVSKHKAELLITVIKGKDAQPASPLEIRAFLKLLADIAKRIINEESSSDERKVS